MVANLILAPIDRIVADSLVIRLADMFWAVHIADKVDYQGYGCHAHRVTHLRGVVLEFVCYLLDKVDAVLHILITLTDIVIRCAILIRLKSVRIGNLAVHIRGVESQIYKQLRLAVICIRCPLDDRLAMHVLCNLLFSLFG